MRTQSLITDILKMVDSVTLDFVKNGYQAISSYWLTSGLLGSILTLYILLYLYQMKYQDLPISEGTIRIIKFTFIFVLVTNWGVFYTLIYKVTTDEPLLIANKLMPNQSANGAINQFFSEGVGQGLELLKDLPISPKGIVVHLLSAGLVFLGTCMFFLYAMGLVIISKFYLSVLLAIAPYFIVAHVFDATKGLTESFAKSCLNYALVPLFVGAVMLLATRLASNFLHAGPSFTAKETMGFEQILGYLFCSLISLYLFKTIPEKAASLTASLAMSGGGKMMNFSKNHAKTAQSAAQSIKKGYRGFKQELDKRQSNLMGDIAKRNKTKMTLPEGK